MSRYVATVLDTTGIQPYIFGSNRLRENIGGSYLVDQATNEWAKEALRDLGQQQNRFVHIPSWEKPEEKPHIEDGEIAAELVYAGGGNTVLLFDSMDSAQQFTRILSSRILREAPGINLVAAHQEFQWDESLYEVIEDLMKNELDRQKRGRIPSAPLLGLGVTASCRSTQLVAIDTSDNDHGCPMSYLVSREIVAKLDAVQRATQNLAQTLFDPKVPKKYKIPLDFDDFGRSVGENSYLAIVHADGNDMGKRFQNHGKDRENRDYIIAMRELSYSVHCAGLAALKEVGNAIINSIDSEGKIKGKLAIKNNFLPFRPLVYGGDDVTFVCDGRLGLELASIYLNAFKHQPVADGKPLSACAGICIVKAHYPFARAYELSEQLCKSAKKFLLGQKKNDLSAIDWHIAASGLFGTISDIRNREYQVEAGDLTIRPVLLEQFGGQWRTWPNFTSLVKTFNEDDNWKNRRNKIIALREKLREGEKATREFIKIYGLTNLPPIAEGGKPVQTSGWTKKQCGYFDAIEAMEFYISLNEEESSEHLSTKN